jgi:hypothetical protein
MRQLFSLFMLILLVSSITLMSCSQGDSTAEDGDVGDGDAGDGDVPDGDGSDGDQMDGDQMDGDVPDGDVPDGDGSDGDQMDGDQTDGDVPDGDLPDGDGNGWDDCGYVDADHDPNEQHGSPLWGNMPCLIPIEPLHYFSGEDDDDAWLTNPISAWYECVTYDPPGAEPDDSSENGYYGVGNGTVFGLVGAWAPRNTIHGMLGPDYNKRGAGFFSDFRATLRQDDEQLDWSSDKIWMPRETQIVVTRQTIAVNTKWAFDLGTLTFSPPPGSAEPLKRVIVQVINVYNPLLTEQSNVSVRVQSYSKPDELGEVTPYIQQLRDDHKLRVAPVDADQWIVVEAGFNDWPALETKPFDLQPKESRVFTVVYEFTTDSGEPGAGLQAVAESGFKPLLEQTRDWWHNWHAQGLRIDTMDDRVNDLIMGLKGAIRLQIADTGALVPMSHYTATWLRDSYAPARTLLKFGYPEDAWAIMDYYFHAASQKGHIGNSMDSDLIFDEPPAQPDWYANMPFNGRERGEGPSHIPLSHAIYWRYTGEGDDLAERWDYLMHALKGQGITDDETSSGLMYFSGDETFRPQLSANLGLEGGANYKFEDLCYSANTAFLFVEAAEELAAYAREYGLETDDIQWLENKADEVRAATEQYYWLESEQRYSPFIYMESMQPETSPAEDVNTQPLWTGYLDQTDAKARENILSSFEAIGQENHLLQIVPPEPVSFMGYDVGGGLMTGMSPAYFLYNVADLALDWADATFDSVGDYVSRSGNAYEVGTFSQPGKPFCPLYFRNGTEGELYARFRPWEGAIIAEALEHFLIGYEANITAGSLRLAPRLPHDVPREQLCDYQGPDFSNATEGRVSIMHVNADGLPFGDERLDMVYKHVYETGYLFTLTVKSGKTFKEIGVSDLKARLYTVANSPFVFDPEKSFPAGLHEQVTIQALDETHFEVVFALENLDENHISLAFGVTR